MAKVNSAPEGYGTVTPYMIIQNAAEALEFYKKALGAKELMRYDAGGGKIGHAEIQIGDSRIMIADEYPEMGIRGPKAFGGTPVFIHLYVEDCDRVFNQAVASGARVIRPMEDQFYGDRSGMIEDPFGHLWSISTHKEELSHEEIRRREELAKSKK